MMPVKENQIKVAVATDFLTGFSKIPRKQQGKVLEFVNKFRSDPMSPGINYEKILHSKDKNIRLCKNSGRQ